jgi:tetratricopeptide (TPR) repeat protein
VLPQFRAAETLADADEALRLAQGLSWRAGEAFAFLTRSTILYSLGEYERALEDGRAGTEIAREIQHQQWLSYGHGVLGWIYSDFFAFQEAENEINHALRLVKTVESPLMTAFHLGGLVDVYLAQGKLEEAQALLDGALLPYPAPRALIERKDASFVPALTISQRTLLAAYAELTFRGGDSDSALGMTDRLIASTPNLADGAIVPRLWRLRAQILISQRQYSDAERLLLDVKRFAQDRDAKSLLWRIHAALGELYELQLRPLDAEREFFEARQVVQQLAEKIPEPTLKEHFTQHSARLVRSPIPDSE